MKRKKLSLLTYPEIQHIISLANFTELQNKIFLLLCSERSDIFIMVDLYLSNRKYYSEKTIIYSKIKRVLGEENALGL